VNFTGNTLVNGPDTVDFNFPWNFGLATFSAHPTKKFELEAVAFGVDHCDVDTLGVFA